MANAAYLIKFGADASSVTKAITGISNSYKTLNSVLRGNEDIMKFNASEGNVKEVVSSVTTLWSKLRDQADSTRATLAKKLDMPGIDKSSSEIVKLEDNITNLDSKATALQARLAKAIYLKIGGTTQLDKQFSDATAKSILLEENLKRLDRNYQTDYKLKIDNENELSTLKEKLNSLNKQYSIIVKSPELKEVDAAISRVKADLNSFKTGYDVAVKAVGVEKTEAAVKKLESDLSILEKERIDIIAKIDTNNVTSQINNVKSEISSVESKIKTGNMKLDVDIKARDEASATLTRVKSDLASIHDKTVVVNVKQNVKESVHKINSGLKDVGSAGSGLKNSAISSFVGNLGSNIVYGGMSKIGGVMSDVVSEADDLTASTASFKTQMKLAGKSSAQTKSAFKGIQDYAIKTVYSTDDVMGAYKSGMVIDPKNPLKYAKAIGGLAAAADKPSEAYKTLNTQIQQMMGAGKVLVTDTRPIKDAIGANNMALVAQALNYGKGDKAIKAFNKDLANHKVNYLDLINAYQEVGENPVLQKYATQFHSFGQAYEGVVSNIATKLQPVISKAFDKAMPSITKFANALGNMNFGNLGDKLGTALSSLFDTLSKPEVIQGFVNALIAMVDVLNWLLSHQKEVKLFAITLGSIFVLKEAASGLLAIKQLVGGIVSIATGLKNLLFGKTVIDGLTGAATKTTGVFKLLGIVLTSPWTWAIIGVIALGAAIWAFFAKTETGQKLWKKFTTWVGTSWKGLVKSLTSGKGIPKNGLLDKILTFSGPTGWITKHVINFGSKFTKGFTDYFKKNKINVGKLWNNMFKKDKDGNTILKTGWGKEVKKMHLGDAFSAGFKKTDMYKSFKGAGDGISDWFNDQKKTIKHDTAQSAGWFKGIGKGIKDAFNKSSDIKKAFHDMFPGAATILPDPKGFIDFFSGIASGISNVWSSMVNFLSSAWSGFTSWFSSVLGGIRNAFTVAVNWIKSVWNNAMNLIKNVAQSAWNAITTGFTNLMSGITDLASSAWTSIQNVWSTVSSWFSDNVIEPVKGFFSDLWKSIVDGTSSAVDGIVGWFSDLGSKIWDKITGIADIGKNIVKGIWDGITSMADWFWQNITGFGKKIGTILADALKIGSPSKLMADKIGKWIPAGVAVGMDRNLTSVINSANNLKNSLVGSLSNFTPTVGIPQVSLPSSANSSISGNAQQAYSTVNNYNITINASTSTSRDTAQQVRKVLRQEGLSNN